MDVRCAVKNMGRVRRLPRHRCRLESIKLIERLPTKIYAPFVFNPNLEINPNFI